MNAMDKKFKVRIIESKEHLNISFDSLEEAVKHFEGVDDYFFSLSEIYKNIGGRHFVYDMKGVEKR